MFTLKCAVYTFIADVCSMYYVPCLTVHDFILNVFLIHHFAVLNNREYYYIITNLLPKVLNYLILRKLIECQEY